MKSRRPFIGASIGALIIATALMLTTPWSGSAGEPGTLDDGKDLLPQAGISLDEAIAAAQTAASGAIGEVDLEYQGGTLVFNVDVGRQDVKVDAATGKVIGSDQDD
jgi:uncharacterized membrane protein YkoI